MSQNLNEVTEARGGQYGDFSLQALLTQSLERVALTHAERMGVPLNPTHREALHMIFHKIARICNGNPNNPDSWLDIAGYAQITYDRLPDVVAARVAENSAEALRHASAMVSTTPKESPMEPVDVSEAMGVAGLMAKTSGDPSPSTDDTLSVVGMRAQCASCRQNWVELSPEEATIVEVSPRTSYGDPDCTCSQCIP